MAIKVMFLAGVLTVAQSYLSNQSQAQREERRPGQNQTGYDKEISDNARRMMDQGRQIFRYDTFGSEDFWGG
jgi:hypothetical protein